jgi:hypothetical protein
MSEKIIKLCIEEINKINSKINRKRYKPKYSDTYYLTLIFHMLNNSNNWKFLSQLKLYDSVYENHYKSIYNKFLFWTKKDIFKNAFYNFKYNHNTNLLLIDATSNNNKYGSENVGINPEFRKKNVTKLSAISTENKFILSIVPFDIKDVNKKYKTLVHDVKMVQKSLDEIKIIKNKSTYYHLLADKAYLTSDKIKLNYKNVKIITPDKKNRKIKNNYYKNKKLKKRVRVENSFCNVKRNERVKTRKDRNLITYMSWVFISCLINNIKC